MASIAQTLPDPATPRRSGTSGPRHGSARCNRDIASFRSLQPDFGPGGGILVGGCPCHDSRSARTCSLDFAGRLRRCASTREPSAFPAASRRAPPGASNPPRSRSRARRRFASPIPVQADVARHKSALANEPLPSRIHQQREHHQPRDNRYVNRDYLPRPQQFVHADLRPHGD